MSEWMYKRGGGRSKLFSWLDMDAWIDSSLHDSSSDARNAWARASAFFMRFRVTGVRKAAVELASEGLTLGAGGLVVLMALAIPSFDAVNREDWRATGQYSVTFVDQEGNELGKRGILHSDAVPLEEVPDYMIKATLATEDRRFFDHFGVDVLGTLRALVENLRANSVVQGGSTLTQQLAKNVFLSSERSLERKIKEAFLALWLESRLTKQEILKLYLDRAYMGGGAFGVEAASQFYFGKSVRDITLAEASLMAGLYKAPTKYAPHVNLAASRARTSEVLDNLVEAGFMTEGQVHGARLNPANIVQTRNPNSPDWYLDWAFEEVRRLVDGRGEFVLTATTTLDTRMQQVAETAVKSVMTTSSQVRKRSQAALVGLERDGAVRAIVGGRDYGRSQFNRATSARRQPGSSFKPYVYLAALQAGDYSPRSSVRDSPFSCGRGHSIKNYSGGFRGRMTLARALAKSTNTVAVKLSHEVGRKEIIRQLEEMGVTGVRPSCTMALGDTGITALSHTGAYAVFANGGMEAKPYGILEIANSRGDVIYRRTRDEPKPKRLYAENDVADLNYMLGQVVTGGTGGRAKLDFTTAAGKTGTSSGYRDAWFMGYTGKYIAGVWFGNDDFRPTARVTGGSLPAMIWKEFMTGAHASPNIPPIPGLPLHPAQVAEMQRLERIRAAQPKPLPAATTRRNAMAKRTKEILSQLAQALEQAKEGTLQRQATAPSNDPDAG
ncbi:MAG: PBP1A family penicillin-binding protein [Pseudomonadota bacterium]